MLRVDLEAAGIPYDNELGRCDFHSLRHTFASMLNEANVPMMTAQKLLRHSDPKLTANIYTHVLVDTKAKALDQLPRITAASEKEAAVMTGTDGVMGDVAIDREPLTIRNSPEEIDWKIDLSGADQRPKRKTYTDNSNVQNSSTGETNRNAKIPLPQGPMEVYGSQLPSRNSTRNKQVVHLL